jgi:hypothetical protein
MGDDKGRAERERRNAKALDVANLMAIALGRTMVVTWIDPDTEAVVRLNVAPDGSVSHGDSVDVPELGRLLTEA